MKKYLLVFAIMILLFFSISKRRKITRIIREKLNATVVNFTDTIYNFGVIPEGKEVSYIFHFRNVGNLPLIITDAKTSCGCTVPIYPDKPIAPGKTGAIKVIFNSNGKSGIQDKIIDLVSNAARPRPKLHFKGIVMRNKSGH